MLRQDFGEHFAVKLCDDLREILAKIPATICDKDLQNVSVKTLYESFKDNQHKTPTLKEG